MKKKTLDSKAYAVKRSPAGLGLYAGIAYKRGDFIIEYTGERISEDEANRRGGRYLFTVTEDITIDGKGRKNIARYINHSCAPNAEAESDEDELKIRIFARRKINPGDEILYDYGKEHWDEYIQPHGCKCTVCVQ